MLHLISTITPYAIGVLGLWLMKPRKGKTEKRIITSKDTKGRTQQEEIYLHEYSSDSPSEAVVKALAKLFGLAPDVIAKAMKQAETPSE